MSAATQDAPQHSADVFARLGQTGLATLITVATLFFFLVSPMLLFHWGFNYEAPGGNPLEKIHPGSLLVFASFAAIAARHGHPLRYLNETLRAQPGVAIFLVAWTMLLVDALFLQKVPFTPLIDTFLVPMLMLIVFKELSARSLARLARLMHVVITINGLLGLFEYLTGYRLTPYVAGTLLIEGDWRATALFGHPLANALVTGAYILLIAVGGGRDLPPLLRPVLMVMQLAAMVAFGGRSSLVLMLACLAFVGLREALLILRGKRFSLVHATLGVMAIPLAIAAVGTLIGGGFFDQLAERFVEDRGSAKSRLIMIDLLNRLPWPSLLFGSDQEYVGSQQRLEGIEYGLESFWISMVITYGGIISVIFFAGLAAFCRDLLMAAQKGTMLLLVYFFAVQSTSVGLAAKTCVFVIFVSMVRVFLRRDAKTMARNTVQGGGWQSQRRARTD